jgi:4-hydroxybenzoate polyprenyltransferase
MVKFEHTIFALPFAYLGMVLAAGGWPGWRTFIWITVAMAAARTLPSRSIGWPTASMMHGTAHETGRCPRRISPAAVGALAGVALLMLALAAWQLNPLCWHCFRSCSW